MKTKVARRILNEGLAIQERLVEAERRLRSAREAASRAEADKKAADERASDAVCAFQLAREAICRAEFDRVQRESEALFQATEVGRTAAGVKEAERKAEALEAQLRDPRFADAKACLERFREREESLKMEESAPLSPENVEGLKFLRRVFCAGPKARRRDEEFDEEFRAEGEDHED